jgi:hypothetical protein
MVHAQHRRHLHQSAALVRDAAAAHLRPFKRPLIRDVRWRFAWFQGQACSGEAALDEGRPVLDLLQAVPDDLDQVAEAGV